VLFFISWREIVTHRHTDTQIRRHTPESFIQCKTQSHKLQHTAIHSNTLQHAVTHCNSLQLTATLCNTLQYTCTTTAMHNAVTHTATHCNTLALLPSYWRMYTMHNAVTHTATHCNTLQTHCKHTANTLQTHCNTLQHSCTTATMHNAVTLTATHCNTLAILPSYWRIHTMQNAVTHTHTHVLFRSSQITGHIQISHITYEQVISNVDESWYILPSYWRIHTMQNAVTHTHTHLLSWSTQITGHV